MYVRKNITWIASAKALSWSIGSPSLWIVIFCSTRVSTMPSRSVLYYTIGKEWVYDKYDEYVEFLPYIY